jgi:hypothetical protein
MRTIQVMAFMCMVSIIAVSFTMAQEKSAIPQKGFKVISDAEGKSSVTPKERYLIRVKTRSAVDVTGSVVRIDRTAKIITLQGKGKTITFDMINPSFIGYENLDEVKKGDTVTVSYIKEGLQIRKGLPPAPPQPKTARVNTAPPRASGQKKAEPKTVQQKTPEATAMQQKKPSLKTEAKRPQKTAAIRTTPVRLRDKPRSSEFRDVDNNKDGKVSPVELTVIFPDLTLQQFREYDKNGNGSLDESEFRAAKRNR